MTLKIAIIDDEKHACETLAWLLKTVNVQHQLIGMYQKPAEAISALSKNTPDLLLLDIEMPGLNGFQLLNELNLPNVHVIFTTAYDEFALKAFKVNAVDYLIKPVDSAELEAALLKVELQRNPYKPEMLEQLFSQMNRSKMGVSKIALPSAHGIDFVNCNEIIYCQSDSNYCRIFLESGRKILVSKTLKEIELMLPKDLFLRIHNSYIANLSFVASFINHDGGSIVLNNNVKLKVSRTRKKEILERLSNINL
jgi:two-component system LytT family response regulator